jgi:hypothetical protein
MIDTDAGKEHSSYGPQLMAIDTGFVNALISDTSFLRNCVRFTLGLGNAIAESGMRFHPRVPKQATKYFRQTLHQLSR